MRTWAGYLNQIITPNIKLKGNHSKTCIFFRTFFFFFFSGQLAVLIFHFPMVIVSLAVHVSEMATTHGSLLLLMRTVRFIKPFFQGCVFFLFALLFSKNANFPESSGDQS